MIYGKPMSRHNYTNPAFCQKSEYFSSPPAKRNGHIDDIYNRSLQSNYNIKANKALPDSCDGPLRIQRSMSTRSVLRHKAVSFNNPPKRDQQQKVTIASSGFASNSTVASFDRRGGSGRYAIVPVEELPTNNNQNYAIISDPNSLDFCLDGRYAKSEDNLENLNSQTQINPEDREPHSFHEDPRAYSCNSSSLNANETSNSSKKSRIFLQNRQQPSQNLNSPNIKHAFSSDFGSKSFLLVDKNSNQRYQMVPTAENEELVDDNHEVIQMHNGKAHRYAVIPTEDNDDEDDYDISHDPENNNTEEETCLSTTDLNKSHHQRVALNGERNRSPICTSTPQKLLSGPNCSSHPNTPMKNLAATKMLQEILSTPPRNVMMQRSFRSQPNTPRTNYIWSSQRDLNRPHSDVPRKNSQLSPQRLYYETVKQPMALTQTLKQNERDRTMAVIQPRLATSRQIHSEIEEEDCNSIQAKSLDNNLYPQKIANATVTLAIVSLMLVLGSSMNLGLIVYMIARMGKSFYLQFSLMAAFCGFGLGFLGFRSRHCEWLPNRSYISGYVLLTIFCLLKCCGLLVILVLDPFPGLPLHDVTTGVILALSTFSMFFIGLGVIGSLWCYRPPPDNRVNIV
uniref:Sanpodo n=1 Tax=Glossina brevipalpis TaxID=37001 RepID=A0A1A9WN32_9MUSC